MSNRKSDSNTPFSLDGILYIDFEDHSQIELSRQVASSNIANLVLGDIEDINYVYESPTVVLHKGRKLVGRKAINSFFDLSEEG